MSNIIDIKNFVFINTELNYGNKMTFEILSEEELIGKGEVLLFNSKEAIKFKKTNPNYDLHIGDALESVKIVEANKYDKIKNRINYNKDAITDGHPVFGKIAILKEIIIEKEYRGKGIGSLCTKLLIEHLKSFGVNFVILRPEPIEVNGINELERIKKRKEPLIRLINFYTKLGFIVTGKEIITTYGAEIIHMIFEVKGSRN